MQGIHDVAIFSACAADTVLEIFSDSAVSPERAQTLFSDCMGG